MYHMSTVKMENHMQSSFCTEYFRMVNKKTRICVVEHALFNERKGAVVGGNYKKQIDMTDSL